MSGLNRVRGEPAGGQALVEFSLAIIVFLVLLMGVFDFGRGIYTYNGVSQAAREIARRTSVHTSGVGGFGTSAETQSVVAVQRGLVPNMGTPTVQCVDSSGAPIGGTSCKSGDFVRVTVSATYTPISLLGLAGTFTLSSSSSIQVP